jgi:hypothetical protein
VTSCDGASSASERSMSGAHEVLDDAICAEQLERHTVDR